MRRTIHQRVIAIVMALVFLLSGAGELFAAHVCPQHDPIVYEAIQGATEGHAAAHAHADHHRHDQPASPAESDAGREHCTCLGVCPTSSLDGLPSEALQAVEVALDWVPVEHAVPADVVLPRFIPFFLPYSQAPPFLS
jgi:hypothetical protein